MTRKHQTTQNNRNKKSKPELQEKVEVYVAILLDYLWSHIQFLLVTFCQFSVVRVYYDVTMPRITDEVLCKKWNTMAL